MSTENRSGSYFDNFNPGIPSAPPVERGDAPELQAWADDRMAIYASLDAAMTKHIVEAVRSLNELKRWVEEDARQTMLELGKEREALQQEVKELREQKKQLRSEVSQVQRQLEEARATRMAVEREAQDLLRESETERERLQREISRLTSQMDSMGQQLQAFMQERFSQLWENFVESMATPGQAAPPLPELPFASPRPEIAPVRFEPKSVENSASPAPAPVKPSADKGFELFNPKELFAEEPELAPVVVEPELDLFATQASSDEPRVELSPDAFELEEFDDTPTPRLEGGSPIIRPDKKASSENDLELRDWRNKMEPEHDLPLSRLVPQNNRPAEKVNPAPGPSAEEIERERERRERERTQEIEQRLQRWFGKREAVTPPPVPAPEPASEPPVPVAPREDKLPDFIFEAEPLPVENKVPEFIFEPAEEKPQEPERELDNLSFGDKPTIVPRASTPAKEKEAHKSSERAALEEIGAKLGLDVITPPSIGAVRFARGFNPRDNRPSRPVTPSAGAGSAPVPPLRPPVPEVVPPVEYVPESFPTEVMPKIIDFKPRNGLNNSRAEVAAGAESEPTTPAPRIGEIGDDFAHNFTMRDLPLPPLPLVPPEPPEPEPIRRIGAVPMPQPPGGVYSEHSNAGDLQTKVTISNLQGLSLLMMEKVVRGLPGVHHVTVTDFRKGVLEMDVRHSPDVKLEEVLFARPDLKLTLVERGPNSLEFLQEK